MENNSSDSTIHLNNSLENLRAILLKDDRAEMHELQNLVTDLADNNRLAERVSPIFEQRIDEIKANFPKEFGALVDASIEVKLKASQDDLLNIIYPMLGKMIKKFVQQQIEELKETINHQTEQALSWENWKNRLRALFLGVKDADVVISNLNLATIEEIYVIQFNSGLLLGSYSSGETIDRDLIVGMFTAIKSFAEDSFSKAKEDLEQIEYGSYKILIQNFHSYYITFVVSGAIGAEERNKLKTKALDFAEAELRQSFDEVNSIIQNDISNKLKQYFISTDDN